MTNTELLMKYIERSGLKLGFIADEMHLSRFGLSKKINNINEFKASEIEKLCSILNISLKDRSKVFFAKKVE